MKIFEYLKSKRFTITIYMMLAWLVFGVMGILYGHDMASFAAYFAALSPFVIGYIYGETKRPSGTGSECCNKNCKCNSDMS
tara:strand:+ start:1133 stop:1375 length:243 start_codon:yes stop_codon:yes gene_type:complete